MYLQRHTHIFLLLGTAALVACGDSTGTGTLGRAQGVITDPATAGFSGTVSGNIQVSISSDGSTWVDLGSLNGITIMLQSNADTTNVHGEVSAPAGSYSQVRLTFSDVSATLNAGSVIGNTTLTNTQTVKLGGTDQQAEVIKSFNFSVTDDAMVRTSLQFRLNSRNWLTEAALAAGFVEDDELAGITVSSRSEPRS